MGFVEDGTAPSIEDVHSARGVHLIRDNTYRFQYISGLGLLHSHFLDCVKLARHAQLHFLDRPRRHAAMTACQRLIEERMR